MQATDAKLLDRIAGHFAESARLKSDAARVLGEPIAQAGQLLARSLKGGGKVLACGNGGSAAGGPHFPARAVQPLSARAAAPALLNRLEAGGPPLAAVALTTDSSNLTSIANDYAWEQVFSKQLRALGRRGDVLLAISTSGNSRNVLEALPVAHELGVRVIALTGNGGGKMAATLKSDDVHICVPHKKTARIQEVHLLVLHCLCDAIDMQLFGSPA